VISSASITATGDFLDLADLPEHFQRRGTRSATGDQWQPLTLDDVRKVHIQRVLGMCQGNRFRAAQILGIGRTSLYRYLKRDGLKGDAMQKKEAAAV
jgi:transcriptional regulator of acetoin/glycerol metabolism